MPVRPFNIHIPQDALDDLHSRLAAIRWPGPLDDDSWEDGAGLAFMRRLAHYWLHRYDWRAQESRLNRLSHGMATIGGTEVHFVHQRSSNPAAMPLIITHGWPGSFIEMERVLPLLTHPEAHGGAILDAFHVVIPSLPGYGFSPAPRAAGVGSREIAQLWRGLMIELGYSRFGCQGGDIGSGVCMWLARQFPDSVIGAHLNYIPASYRPPLGPAQNPVTAEEQAYLDRVSAWLASEGAYAAVHGTKPQTLAYSLSDSPLGLAAWIVEKMRSWSDCDGDVERVFSMDSILTDVCLYWFSGTVAASLRLYKENRLNPLACHTGERVIPPVGMAHFPRELPIPPRSWMERVFNVRRWQSLPRGGHFAALEQPELLAGEIREFFRPLRESSPVRH